MISLPNRTIQRSLAKAAAVCALLLAGAASAADHKAEILDFSVPIGSDGVKTSSGLRLRLQAVEYRQPLDRFAAGASDAKETALARFMNAIRQKNHAEAEGVFRAAVLPAGKPGKVPASAEVVDMFNGFFNGFTDVSVLYQCLVEGKSVFVWEGTTSEKSRLSRGFVVDSNADKTASVSLISSRSPLEEVIVETVLPANRVPSGGAAASAGLFSSRVGLTSPGYPPSFVFAGAKMDFDVLGGTAPADEVLKSYQAAWVAMRDDKAEEFLKYWTPASAAKYRAVIDELKKNGKWGPYRDATAGPRYVKFVLRAEPFYLIFYSAAPLNNWVSGTLRYDYMVQREGKVLLTNYYYQSFLDGLLRDPLQFDQSVFRPKAAAK